MTGMIDKPIYVITAMYMPGSGGEIATNEEMLKINKLVQHGLTLLQNSMANYDSKNKHSKLILESLQANVEIAVAVDGAKFIIHVEDFDDNKLNARAEKTRAVIRVPKKKLQQLPNHNIIGEMSTDELFIYDFLLNHFLHEILHTLGAYHSSVGIMSGTVPLVDKDTISLCSVLDNITARIISKALTNQISFSTPDVLCKFKDGKLDIFANFPIHTVVLLNRTYYTRQYFFVDSGNELKFPVLTNLQWDAIIIQLIHGELAYFVKDHLTERMREPDSLRSRLPMDDFKVEISN